MIAAQLVPGAPIGLYMELIQSMWQYSVSPRSVGDYVAEGDTRGRAAAEEKLRQCSVDIEREPHNAKLYLNRSRIATGLGQYDLAIEDLSNALRLDPKNNYFYLFLRHLQHVYRGELAKALEDIQRAVDLAPPEHNDYYKCLAYVHQQLGQTDKAIEALTEGVRKFPKSAQARLRRAAFFDGIGMGDAAVEDATAAIRLEKERWRVFHIYHDRAKLFARLGRFDEALADCNHCIQAQPKEWTHYSVRSEVYTAMGNEFAAHADYMRSLELNPSMNR